MMPINLLMKDFKILTDRGQKDLYCYKKLRRLLRSGIKQGEHCWTGISEVSNITGLADCLDVVDHNYKEHLYEEDHAKYPANIILGSRNTRGIKNGRPF